MPPASEASEVADSVVDAVLGSPHEQRRIVSTFRLRVAFTLFVIALLAALLALVYVLVSHIFGQLTPAIRSDLRWKTQRGAMELARSAEYGMALRDADLIARTLRPYESDRDILAVVVTDANGQVIVSRGKSPEPVAALFSGPPQSLRATNDLYVSWAESEIEGGVVGRVAVTVSTARIHAGTQLKRQILLIFGVGALLALGLTFAFVGLYVSPLMRVTQRAFARLADTTRGALEATRLKSEFIANVSHEIRTPMNGVLGMIELLRRTEMSLQQSKYAETLRSSASALMSVLNDVLDFSKIEAGKIELRTEPCQPRALIAEVVGLFHARAELKGLQLQFVVTDDVPHKVICDRDRLRQVLSNLVGNAIKFTDAGQISLNLRVTARSESKFQLRFEVIDSGSGIPDSAIPSLFEAFSQVDGSLTRRQGGTGLGLAICRTLTHLMDGQIGVESQVGKGSNFWFQVPVVALGAGSTSHVSAALIALSPRYMCAGARVLVADDNPVNCEILNEMLSTLGCAVDVVTDGSQAIAAVAQHDYAIVLMDCQMPILDGYEATRQIRSRANGSRRIPIVAVTAHAMAGERERSLAAGMDDHLTKPVSIASLSDILKRWVSQDTAGNLPPAPSETLQSVKTEGLSLDPDIYRSPTVVRVFANHVPGQLERIAQAIHASDLQELAQAAHGLKGCCTMFGATKMAALCLSLERCTSHHHDIYSALVEEHENVVAEIGRTYSPEHAQSGA